MYELWTTPIQDQISIAKMVRECTNFDFDIPGCSMWVVRSLKGHKDKSFINLLTVVHKGFCKYISARSDSTVY